HVDAAHHGDAEAGAIPECAGAVHQLPGAGDLPDRMALQQPLEMGDQPDDRLVSELTEGQLAHAIFPGFRGDPNEGEIERLDPPAGELVAKVIRVLVAQEKHLDARNLHDTAPLAILASNPPLADRPPAAVAVTPPAG